MKNILQWSGYFNIASGILMLLYWYLYAVLLPYGKISNTLSILVLDPNWTFVNILGVLGSMTGILGLIGLYISIEQELTTWTTIGFLIAIIGGILMFVTLMRDTLLWPILAHTDPSLLDFSGPIYTSRTFMPFFIFSGVLFMFGNIIFGLALGNSTIYPLLAGHLMAWGSLLFIVGVALGPLQVIVRSVGITGLSVGTIWLGVILAGFKR